MVSHTSGVQIKRRRRKKYFHENSRRRKKHEFVQMLKGKKNKAMDVRTPPSNANIYRVCQLNLSENEYDRSIACIAY